MTVKAGVVVAIKVLSLASLLISVGMATPMAICLKETLFKIDLDLPLRILIIYTLDVMFFLSGVIPLDKNVYALISDPDEFYKAVALIGLVMHNLLYLIPTFVLQAIIIYHTNQKFKQILQHKGSLDIETLQEVINIWTTTCSALGMPVFILFSCQQVLGVLVVYACLGKFTI